MPMQIIRARSPGKLNLTFDIVGDLPDGYHQVETLIQALDDKDEMIFKFEPADSFQCTLSDSRSG